MGERGRGRRLPRARARGYNAQENVEGGRGNDGNGNYFPFSARNCSTHEVTAFEHCAFRGLIKSLVERSPNKYPPPRPVSVSGEGVEAHQRKRRNRKQIRPTEEELSRRVPPFPPRSIPRVLPPSSIFSYASSPVNSHSPLVRFIALSSETTRMGGEIQSSNESSRRVYRIDGFFVRWSCNYACVPKLARANAGAIRKKARNEAISGRGVNVCRTSRGGGLRHGQIALTSAKRQTWRAYRYYWNSNRRSLR